MIIDAHTHFNMGSESADPGLGQKIVLNAMRYGVGACVISNVVTDTSSGGGEFPSSEHLRRVNAYAADQAKRNSGRLFFLVYLNPQNKDWDKELERGVSAGAVGIKLWIGLKNSRGGLEETVAVIQRAAYLKLPVLLHVFNRTAQNLPGEIDMAEFAELSRRIPDCVMIAGHAGGNWRESSGWLESSSENTYWELGGSNPEKGMLEEVLRFCPSERLLFGSDAIGRSFISQIQKVSLSHIPSWKKDQIFFRNSMRVFRIPEPALCETHFSDTRFQLPAQGEDHFCFCGKFPFNRRKAISPKKLEKLLKEQNISAAFTADLESIFHTDLLESNRDFARKCIGLQRIRPLAVVNPASHNACKVLESAAMTGIFAGIWTSPVFHNWQINSPHFTFFFRECARLRIPVYVNCGFCEPRFFHTSLRFRPMEDLELFSFFECAPENQYVIQGRIPPANFPWHKNCRWTLTYLTDFEGKLNTFLLSHPASKLVWGSEFPFRPLQQIRDAAVAQLA